MSKAHLRILFPKMIFYPSNVGGRSQAVYWLTQALNKSKNVEPIIVTTNKHIENKIITDKFIFNEAGMVYYSSDSKFFPKKMLLKSLTMIKEVDIIHLSSLFFKANIFIAFYARLQNKKVIWSVRGELEVGALGFKKIYKKIYLYLLRIISGRSILFHSTSDKETENIKKYFPKVEIIQLPNYMKLPNKIEQKTKKQLLFIGRINPIKALDNLLYGLGNSKKFRNSNFELIIAGLEDYPNYKNELIQIIDANNLKDKVRFVGSVNGIEKEKLFAESYFLFLPSHSENFGNVIIESLAQETPVVTSHGTPWEILEKYNAGYWVDNSSESLGNIIDKIIDLPSAEYTKMREQSYKLVKNEFDIGQKIEQWIKVYETCLEKNK